MVAYDDKQSEESLEEESGSEGETDNDEIEVAGDRWKKGRWTINPNERQQMVQS